MKTALIQPENVPLPYNARMDTKTVDTVTKLVNLACSQSAAEAETAARGAVSRLKKSGATLEDFVAAMDAGKVFQIGLVRVAERYAMEKEGLSEPARRELYARLIAGINYRYGGGKSAHDEKEAELRKREEDLRRRERGTAAGARASAPDSGNGRNEPSPSPAENPAIAIWKTDPKRALRIYAASAIFGIGAGWAATVGLALAHVAGGFVFGGWQKSPMAEVPTLGLMLVGGLAVFAVKVKEFAERAA